MSTSRCSASSWAVTTSTSKCTRPRKHTRSRSHGRGRSTDFPSSLNVERSRQERPSSSCCGSLLRCFLFGAADVVLGAERAQIVAAFRDLHTGTVPRDDVGPRHIAGSSLDAREDHAQQPWATDPAAVIAETRRDARATHGKTSHTKSVPEWQEQGAVLDHADVVHGSEMPA